MFYHKNFSFNCTNIGFFFCCNQLRILTVLSFRSKKLREMDFNSENNNANKSHAVCVPFPAQGHINPMFKLAKILHSKGFYITFVNTEYNHRRLLTSGTSPGLPDFRFESIPDGLFHLNNDNDDDDGGGTQDIPSLCESTSKNCLVPFKNLLHKINKASSTSESLPPVSCIIADGSMSFTLDAAQEFGVPEVLFWTPSGCGVLAYTQFSKLVERGLPLKDESYLTNGYLETTIDWIPGMKSIRLKDLPSFIRTTDPNAIMLNFVPKLISHIRRASALILNTYDALEQDALQALSTIFTPTDIYSIGPLHLLEAGDHIPGDKPKEISSNLWKEDSECIKWLDSQKPNSVVFVNFGSIAVLNPNQLNEFAWGLANSQKPFLWIKRRDLVVTGESDVINTDEFLMETKGRGLIASWCPQEKVLKHRSVGVFLSHMGWNSTLESVSAGVPLLCWPFFAEQQTNCKYACNEWGIGMEINSDVKREEIESLVREVMEGEKGNRMRKNAREWKMKAQEAIKPGGSSYQNFEKFLALLGKKN
ncbi:7-deoxyloganetin glucosyltransferase-like [Mercurialis annua]|uniref:7-deoxyloganetin glucosyltransferase-like n=1 Tax=Mercurialis annua TaxID=3986 RepID=UPI0021610974|nr:7-deoxyloganetin glucosyltransferase-like [Mercurialis annua]